MSASFVAACWPRINVQLNRNCYKDALDHRETLAQALCRQGRRRNPACPPKKLKFALDSRLRSKGRLRRFRRYLVGTEGATGAWRYVSATA